MIPRVLFAEDDPSIRESFTAILKLEGAIVTACANADEACSRLATDAYDLVITDMRMETPTAGWKVVRAARNCPHTPQVAIMSAFPIPRAELLDQRVDAILSKGVSITALIARIRDLIQNAMAHPAPRPAHKDGGHDRTV